MRSEQLVQAGSQLSSSAVSRPWSGDDDALQRRFEAIPVQPEIFPDDPLDTVTDDGVAHFAAYRKPQSRFFRAVVVAGKKQKVG